MDRDTRLQAAIDMIARTNALASRFDETCRERDTYARMCAIATLEDRAVDATYWARQYLTAHTTAEGLLEEMRQVTAEMQQVTGAAKAVET